MQTACRAVWSGFCSIDRSSGRKERSEVKENDGHSKQRNTQVGVQLHHSAPPVRNYPQAWGAAMYEKEVVIGVACVDGGRWW